MSDLMLLGVLRMPPELWNDSPLDIRQRHSRYIEAAARIESDAAELEALRHDLERSMENHNATLAELAALRGDALRYRTLRDKLTEWPSGRIKTQYFANVRSPETFDAAIDAARGDT